MSEQVPVIAWNELAPVVSYANLYIGKPGESFGPRIIKDHQFIWVCSGAGRAAIQNRTYEAGHGDLFYYGPDVVHTFTADERDPFVLYGLHFSWRGELPAQGGVRVAEVYAIDPEEADLSVPNGLLIRSDKEEDALLIRDKQTVAPERTEARFARIVDLYRSEHEFVPQLLRSLLLELIVVIKQETLPQAGAFGGSPLIRLVAAKLQEHAERKYDRGWLAEWTAYNPDHISRLFRKETGWTPYDYFMREKLELTKRLLIHTDEPLAAIADRIHAASIHAFTKWFKERTGTPPGKYRQWSRMI